MIAAYLTTALGAVMLCLAVAHLAEGAHPLGHLRNLAIAAVDLSLKAFRGIPLARGERSRLIALIAVSGLAAGVLLSGPAAGVLLGLIAPWSVGRATSWQKRRYRQRFERQLPEVATALANALTGGHAVRGALVEAAREIGGPAGVELAKVAAEIAVGRPTDLALEGLGSRVGSRQLDVLVGAIMIQLRSGGDLAQLLREVAEICEDRQRLAQEAHMASSQARFTGKLVVAMPLVAGAVVELANPGFVSETFTSLIAVWLVAMALLLQVGGALAIRRIARVGIE